MPKSMSKQTKKPQPIKPKLHPRNPHHGRYDFAALTQSHPELTAFLKANPAGDNTIDFSDPKAVLCLNKALLAHFYQIKHWQIPDGYLCPPIPGRADYIHNLADLLAADNQGEVPRGKRIKVLDIGTGANCIYPIIGNRSYGWQFVGSDIDPVAVKTAQAIVQSNNPLQGQIHLRQQPDERAIFNGIIQPAEGFHLTLCNPPFHASLAEATAAHQRKAANLQKKKAKPQPASPPGQTNFGGQMTELYCDGGEITFLRQMAQESKQFAGQVCWFSSLVSKSENVRPLKLLLKRLGAEIITVMNMSQGQKISRVIAWSFLDEAARRAWLGN